MDVRIPIRDRSKGLVPRNAGIPSRGREKKKASDGRGCEDPRRSSVLRLLEMSKIVGYVNMSE